MKTVNDETRMGLYFPLVMQRSGLCPIFMAGDALLQQSLSALPITITRDTARGLLDSLPAECSLDQFSTLLALSRAAVLWVTESR